MAHASNHGREADPSSHEKQEPGHQGGGEDESSSSQDGHDDHLHQDQKPLDNAPESSRNDDDADQPHTGSDPA